jgi:hypothetical protein
MVRRAVLLLAAAAVVCSFTGCAKLVLKHTPLPASGEKIGAVTLVVNNARAKDEGGENPMSVGRLRNMYGMPIRFEAENNVIDAIKALNVDALASAGYQVADGAPTQVVVDVTKFFMDGYMGYKVEVVCNVKAVTAGATAFEKPITRTNGFYYKNNSSLYEAYDALMNMIAQDAVAIYKSPEFKAAVK